MVNRVQGFGLLLAAAAAGLLTWGLQRPAMWLDESATVVATRRTWSGLWSLLNGAEAPLVPYYAMLKLVTSMVGALVPGADPAPELLYRFPSVLASVVAVWALATWVGGRRHFALMLCTSAALLLTAGFSRYGQEARPYAFALLMAVLSTIAWDRMTGDPRRRWIFGYAFTVVLLVTAHLLAGSLVIAHLVAAAVGAGRTDDIAGRRTPASGIAEAEPAGPGTADVAGAGTTDSGIAGVEPGWRSEVKRTLIGIGLGLVLAAPFVVWASGHGVGPTKPNSLTLDHLTNSFNGLFTGEKDLTPGFVLMLVLAAIGTARALRLAVFDDAPASTNDAVPANDAAPAIQDAQEYTRLARIAAAWAFVPPLVLLPALIVRPNLLIGRYLVFVLPGWAILTGLGAVTVAELVRRTVHRLAPRQVLATAIAGGSAVIMVLTAMVFSQIDPITDVRGPAGHSENVRPALAAANRPEYADLPIMLSSLFSSLEVVTYDRTAEARIVGQQILRFSSSIWPVADQQTSMPTRFILLLRAPSPAKCKPRTHTSTKAYARRCLPKPWKDMGYKVEAAEKGGRRWTFIVLNRSGVRSSLPEHSPVSESISLSGRATGPAASAGRS